MNKTTLLTYSDLLRDTGSLRKHLLTLKRRWEGICALTSERRQLVEDTWTEWQCMIQMHQDLQDWINERYFEHYSKARSYKENERKFTLVL